MQEDISILSITDNSILIRFSLFGSEKISYEIEPDNIRGSLTEANSVGRFEISGLKSNKKYKITVIWNDKKKEINFSTFPGPEGKLLCSYGIIGDPHISLKGENRFGRLHVESSQILSSVISQINSLKLDFVLSTGDLTESGSIEEYKLVNKALSLLECPFLTISGNHDFGYGKQSYDLWQKNFGPLSWSKNIKDIPIAGIDTHQRRFHSEANENTIENLRDKPFFIMLSHYQLFEDDHILDEDKAVIDKEVALSELDKIKDSKGIIYVGHKNVPSHTSMGSLLQINVPQPTHYPCGILIASQYSNGVYHRFEPIFSEILNEYSRREISTRNLPETEPGYRDCKLSEKWNFIY